MKILHIISSLSKGGGERVVVELANEGVKNADEVLLVAGWRENPDYLQNQVNPKVIIRFIDETKNFAYLKLLFWIINNRKTIKEFDVFHCHLTYGAVAGTLVHIFLKKIFRYKKPFIFETNHAVGMQVPKFKRWLHSRMLLKRDGVVLMATDPFWQKFISKHALPKIEIIANGISLIATQQTNESKQIFLKQSGISAKCKYIVGTVGMLRPDRQPWLYIPIFKIIHEELGDEVHFVMAGAGQEKDKIEALIREHGLTDHVLLPGLVTDAAALIANFDIYISLSVGGAAGISMIEAAMCKVPVLGIQLMQSYKSSDKDWFWSHTDAKEVAKKAICLLQNETDRNKIAFKQYDFVNNNFTSSAMYNSYNSFYKKVINA